jgi:hypothetical protein
MGFRKTLKASSVFQQEKHLSILSPGQKGFWIHGIQRKAKKSEKKTALTLRKSRI